MAWRRLIKEVRPNMETPFFAASDEDILHIHEKYESTGKCSVVDISYSSDGLTLQSQQGSCDLIPGLCCK